MIRTIALLTLILFVSSLYGQGKTFYNYKVTYKLDYKKGLDAQTRGNDYFALYTSDSGSEFVSIGRRALDSISTYKDHSLSLGQFKSLIPEHTFSYVLYYDKATKELSMTQFFTNVGVGYKEDIALPWQLTGETKKVKGYLCQKATVTYEGRSYEAWFTLDIPLQEGPYKFKGLPGLIVQIADTENEYVFDFMGIKKLDPQPESFYFFKDVDMTTKATFRTIKKKFTENPFAMFSQSGIAIDLSPAEKASMIEAHKKNLLKTNNTIERY